MFKIFWSVVSLKKIFPAVEVIRSTERPAMTGDERFEKNEILLPEMGPELTYPFMLMYRYSYIKNRKRK